MKYSIYISILSLFLLAACNDQQNTRTDSTTKETDSSKKTISHEDTNTGGNHVRSEAPDAITKTEQGYALPSLDTGHQQSPVNILSGAVGKESADGNNLLFHEGINAVENLGHTIQLDFSDGTTASINGIACLTKQLHFHTPSEHLIDGITYPMEMHIVNTAKISEGGKTPGYVVVGVLFKMGRESRFLKEFLKSIPEEADKKMPLQPGNVVLEDLFDSIPKTELEKYYHYQGSLTTPPYSENVQWYVRKHIFEASAEQISAMEKLEGDNARHVQALYSRKITSN